MNHEQQKEHARRMAEHHRDNSNVVESRYAGTKEGFKKDIYYHQDRDEYLAKQREYQEKGGYGEPPRVPKSMMEEEYENGVHSATKHAARHKEYNK